MKRFVFLDCGTHEGQGLSELAVELESGCEVHCFEPNPVVSPDREVLLASLAAKGVTPSSLEVHHAAVFDRDGTVTFNSIGGFPRGTQNGRGQASSIAGVGQTAGTVSKNTVPSVDLLNFIRGLSLVDGDEVHIKLDVEGAEFAILDRLLAHGEDVLPFVKRMWIEWHHRFYGGTKDAAVGQITKDLERRGVVVYTWQ